MMDMPPGVQHLVHIAGCPGTRDGSQERIRLVRLSASVSSRPPMTKQIPIAPSSAQGLYLSKTLSRQLICPLVERYESSSINSFSQVIEISIQEKLVVLIDSAWYNGYSILEGS